LSLDSSILLVEGASDSSPLTSASGDDNEHFINKTVGSGVGIDEEAFQRDKASIAAAEQEEAEALLEWCEKPARREATSAWQPGDDAHLAAGVRMFPTGEAHRWRSIAEMVPGKNTAQCQSRARSEDFIKAHRYSGEKKGTTVSKPPLDSLTWDGDTDARLAELITALPGGTTRRCRAIARALGGGWSADDCLRRAASLATSPSKTSGKGGGTSLMEQNELPNPNQISTKRVNAWSCRALKTILSMETTIAPTRRSARIVRSGKTT
jgi:hypothetical protein